MSATAGSVSAAVIDRYLDVFDLRTAHSAEVDAPAPATYRAARALDLSRSLPVAALFLIRGLPHLLTGRARPSRSLTLETFLEAGFTIFEEDPPHHLVMGVAGKFWRPDSGLIRLGPDEFERFDEPGYAKAVMSFVVAERGRGSLLTTETRVFCTDDSARRKFALYWSAIGPFSRFIRRIMLGQIKSAAQAG